MLQLFILVATFQAVSADQPAWSDIAAECKDFLSNNGISLSDLTEATYNANYARQNEELPFELEVTCYTLLTEEQASGFTLAPPDVTYFEEDCKDNSTYATNCPSWASLGFCNTTSTYYSFMSSHCKKSCKICTDCDCQNGGECGEPEKNCTDTAQYATRCPNWAKYGYCTVKEYYSFMSANCRKTCEFCTVEQGSCNCTEGWTGEKCETRDCGCRNNGTCMSNGTCDCLDGFSGEKCQEKERKDCRKKCRKGKVCYWKNDDHMKCRCPDGSYGKGCGEKVDCSMKEGKVCTRKMKKDKTEFLEKCKKPWGVKKCPHSCGFCKK